MKEYPLEFVFYNLFKRLSVSLGKITKINITLSNRFGKSSFASILISHAFPQQILSIFFVLNILF